MRPAAGFLWLAVGLTAAAVSLDAPAFAWGIAAGFAASSLLRRRRRS